MNPFKFEEHAYYNDYATGQQLDKTTLVKQEGPSDKDVERFFLQVKALMALKHKKNDSQPAQIMDNIYLGSIGAALSKPTLQTLKISHILICADTLKPAFPTVCAIQLWLSFSRNLLIRLSQ